MMGGRAQSVQLFIWLITRNHGEMLMNTDIIMPVGPFQSRDREPWARPPYSARPEH
jgi:hypothetical protein